MKDIAKIYLGLTYTPKYVTDGVPFLSVKDIGGGKLNFDKTKFISREEYSLSISNAKPKSGDVLFGRVGTLGKPIVITDEPEFCIFVSLGYLRVLDEKVLNYFLKFWMESDLFKKQIDSKISGSSQKNLNTGWLYEFSLSLPSIEEQQQISSFFMLLNRRIEKQQEKIDKLGQFKKGIMQKIFSQELRFKDEDGGDFGEWKPTTFHEVADIRRGASPRPIADPKWFSATSKIGWLRISDVTASGVYLKEVTQYLSEEGIKKSVLLEEPHLILSIAATIGKPVINKIPLCIHDGFIVFKNLKLDILFGYYYLEHFQDKWLQFRQPGSQFNLNSDLVGNLNIMIPSKEEQEAIAKFFSIINEKIEKEKEKLLVLEEQKNGFMQGMFV